MSEVGQEIRRLREAKGWNQPKLAVEAGVAVSGVSQIENGKRNPNSSTLMKLAAALDVEVADLFPKAQSPLPLENRLRVQGSAVLGEAYFVEPEEGEEPDVVTLRINYVRLLEENDRLLREVTQLRERLAEATSGAA
jgi:transcriptional regulator with XRE-family HTH domain